MTQNTSFLRKIAYCCAIVLLLLPIFLLGQPATRSAGGDGAQESQLSSGGTLARMRSSYGLSQAELGRIDPASETMKMATLGLRGVATNILWTKANRYKMTESWDKLSATLNQIAKLQPNYISVWEFQAHNLSYNVSVEFDNYQHRYHWVKKGIDFLIEGTRYNKHNPRLFWNVGWFIGHKFGISDEKVQFRRMFRLDEDFHNTMVDYIDVNKARGLDGYPDNWLVSYLWYKQSEAVVESGVPVTWMPVNVNEKGYTDKRRSSVIFYSDPSLALINHADAANDEYEPGEKTQRAWRNAGDEWAKFGAMDIPTSWGHTIRLNSLEQYREKTKTFRAKLEELAPGLREQIRERRLAALTPDERTAWETTKPYDELSEDESMARTRAFQKLIVTDLDVAAEVPEASRAKARFYASQATEANQYVNRTDAYQTQVNYPYWQTRCEVEQSDTTAAARRYVKLADDEAEKSNPEKARELYEQAWDEWVKIFEAYPDLVHDVMAEDLYAVIVRYKRVLDQLDEEFPENFKLQWVIEEHADPDSPLRQDTSKE